MRQNSTEIDTGGSLTLGAGRDLVMVASAASVGDEAYLYAGRNLAMLAAEDRDYYLYDEKKKGGWGSRKTKRDEVTTITQIGSSVTAEGDVTLTSGADQRYQAASLASGADLTLDAGGDITFEAVKDLEQESHEKSSSSWAWASAKGKGTTDATVRLSALTAGGELAIKAAGKIRIDVPEVNAKTLSQTIDALVAAEPELAWLKEMEARGDIDWQRVKEVHDSFEYSHSGMGGVLAIVVAIVVTALTWGAASAAVGTVASATAGSGTAMAAAGTVAGTTVAAGWGNVALTSALTSMASNTVINTINSGGDLGKALELSFSEDAIKGYATAAITGALTAGLVDEYFRDAGTGSSTNSTSPTVDVSTGSGARVVTGGAPSFDLNTWSGAGKFAAYQGSRAVVSSAVDSAINGGSFEDKLAASLTAAAVHTVSAAAFNQVGNWAEANKIANGDFEKVAVKALVGGLISQAATGDFATGALAAGANEALVEHLAGLVDHDPQLLSMASQLVGAVAAGASGGDASLGASLALYGTQYNRQLHLTEKQRARELAARSDGRWTAEEIEDAMRWADNLERGETYDHGIAVKLDGATTAEVYDVERSYVSNGYIIQDLNAITRPDAELMSFIQQSTGDAYAWNPSIFPKAPADPNAGMAWTSKGYVPITDGTGGASRYETFYADGQAYRLPVAECPSVVCANAAPIAWASPDPVDQTALRAYEAAVGRQTLNDLATVATVATALTPIGAGRVGFGSVYTGFVSGAGFDAAGQYVQRGEIRPVQTLVAGVAGAAGLPLAARGNLWIPVAGAAIAATNTSFNNFYYGEDTPVYLAAGLGTVFSVIAPPIGQTVTGGANRLLGNPMMYIPASGPVQPMQIYRNASFWAAVPGYAGTTTAQTVGSVPAFIPLDNGKAGAQP